MWKRRESNPRPTKAKQSFSGCSLLTPFSASTVVQALCRQAQLLFDVPPGPAAELGGESFLLILSSGAKASRASRERALLTRRARKHGYSRPKCFRHLSFHGAWFTRSSPCFLDPLPLNRVSAVETDRPPIGEDHREMLSCKISLPRPHKAAPSDRRFRWWTGKAGGYPPCRGLEQRRSSEPAHPAAQPLRKFLPSGSGCIASRVDILWRHYFSDRRTQQSAYIAAFMFDVSSRNNSQ